MFFKVKLDIKLNTLINQQTVTRDTASIPGL